MTGVRRQESKKYSTTHNQFTTPGPIADDSIGTAVLALLGIIAGLAWEIPGAPVQVGPAALTAFFVGLFPGTGE